MSKDDDRLAVGLSIAGDVLARLVPIFVELAVNRAMTVEQAKARATAAVHEAADEIAGMRAAVEADDAAAIDEVLKP